MKTNFIKTVYIFLLSSTYLIAQPCIETAQHPSGVIINAPDYMDSIVVATDSYAGDYFEVNGFVVGKNYTFKTTASPADYLTITTTSNTVIAHGVSPLSLLITGSATLRVHISLVSPPCGNQALNRISKVICNTCVSPANVSIGTNDPANSAVLDVSSTTQALKIPTMTTTQRDNVVEPVEGLIIYNSQDNEINHHNGTAWKKVQSTGQQQEMYFSARNFMPIRNYTGYTGNYWYHLGRGPVEGSKEFYAPLNLPIGTRITELKYHYLDNSTTSNVKIRLGTDISNFTFPQEIIASFFLSSTVDANSSIQIATVILDYTLTAGNFYSFMLEFLTDSQLCALRGIVIKYELP
jgi:hypothetical protein